MEVRAYLAILLKRWWIILIAFAVVFAATFYFTSRQPQLYETKATFIIRPRSEIVVEDEFVRTLDLVSRRVEINTTFAEVANSRAIKRLAIERLQLPTEAQEGLSITGRVIGGTNVLEIAAQGRDPEVARDFANAVGAETVSYVQRLYDVFQLELLDEATTPRNPVSPNLPLNLALGTLLGLALGTGLVFLIEYLKAPEVQRDSFNIIDRETGAYNKSYLIHRLWQEMSRARRNEYPLSLGIIRIELQDLNGHDSSHYLADALRLVKILAEKSLREEDVMARFGRETFALLLPDTDELNANLLIDDLRTLIGSIDYDMGGANGKLQIGTTAGVVAYENQHIKHDQFLDKAVQAFIAAMMERQKVDWVSANGMRESMERAMARNNSASSNSVSGSERRPRKSSANGAKKGTKKEAAVAAEVAEIVELAETENE